MNIVFDLNYVVKADIIALFLCLVVHSLLCSTYTLKRDNLNIFRAANFLVGAAAVTSIIYHSVLTYLTPETVIWAYVFRALSYGALIWTYICFCVYIKNLADMSQKYAKVFKLSIYGMGIVFTLCELIGPVFRLGFYIDENLEIHQNYYTDFFRYAYIYYTISMAVILYVYRKKFIGKMFRCICTVMCFSFALMCFQAEFVETSYTVVSFSFPIIAFLFLFHYNSYDVITGTLDQYSFRRYIEEMNRKNFSMIFLSLPGISIDKLRTFSVNFLRKNDSYFGHSCCFRLQDNRMVLVYQKEKNENYGEIYKVLYQEFQKTRGQSDYYIVMMDSTPEINTGQDYVAFCEYVEACMPLNTTKFCDEKTIQGFLKQRIIYRSLEDIYQKDNLDDPRVKVYCQPVLNIKTNTFTTAEALMRLELPEFGMVFPDEFVPVAEKYDFIHVLSKIILNKTCQNIRQLEEQGYKIDRVSVNFSVQELHLDSFCDDVISIIERNKIPYNKIAIEITETRNEKDFLGMKAVMERLQELDIKFYLDDFGTGYSNFERIIGLPVDIIKFDRSLTILASKNDESKFMVGSFSEIFKKADYQILFEGVEDEHDEEQCIDMNAQYLQGYKYSRPIPMEQLKEFLSK